jgi:hypothetical protein
MAHFAEVDENNIVLQVVVTDNSYPEEGYEWLLDTFGGRWIQTSYNARIRKNFAGVGYSYDESLDAFIAPKPYDSWTLDLETCQWVPPIQRPSGETVYVWDEESLNWKEAV